jgi:hypothetical protein
VAAVVAVSPFDSNFVLVGTNYEDSGNGQGIGGWIHRTDRAMSATSQTFWPRSRPRRGWVSSIAFDPSNKQVVYTAYSSFNLALADENDPKDGRGHLFKSTNGGESWQALDGPCDDQKSTKEAPEPCDVDGSSIPDIPVHAIVVDPADLKRIWVGTDVGIFTSLDAGQTWKEENAGFRVPVEALLLDSQKRSLIAFTHGRGVWTVKLR